MKTINKEMLEVSAKERLLIIALRSRFNYGEVIIIMRDGEPQYVKRAWDSDDLQKQK